MLDKLSKGVRRFITMKKVLMELQSHINEYLIQWEDDMSKKEDIQQFVCQVMKLGSLANVIGPHSGKVDVPESIDDWRINDNEITFVMTDGSEYRLFVYRDRHAVVEGYEDAHVEAEIEASKKGVRVGTQNVCGKGSIGIMIGGKDSQ